jgi:hypothetical protein
MTIYDIAKGVTGLSNALNQANSNYALQAHQMNNASRIGWGDLLGAATGVGSSAAQGKAMGSAMAASDIRLKENLEKLDEVNGFNIYKFDYINGEKDQVGVIAQEMQEKCPECVVEKGDYLAVDYSKLPKEVQTRIEELR